MNIIESIENNKFLPADKPDSKFWYDQDTKERYKQNLKVQPEDWIYRNKIVVYNTNSDGYRTKEFDKVNWAKSIVIFGCSYVYGVGNAEDETISYCLEQLTGIPVINMGVPGSSPTFTMHNSAILYDGYPTPKAVVCAWSSPFRCPYYVHDEVIHCGSWSNNAMSSAWNRGSSTNPIANLLLASKIVKQIWGNKTSFYSFSMFSSTAKYINCDYIKQIDKARDLGHAGIETNKIIAKKIMESLDL